MCQVDIAAVLFAFIGAQGPYSSDPGAEVSKAAAVVLKQRGVGL